MIELVRPRIASVPAFDSGLGREAVEFSRAHGMTLDPEQELVLEGAFGLERGKWAAPQVGLNMPRQNGKGEILLARELYGLFVLGESIVHSAHEFKTSAKHFLRLEAVIRGSRELLSLVKTAPSGRTVGFRYGNGDEAVELQSGAKIEFRTRTKSGARGLDDVHLLVLDEAMIISEAALGAMMPTLRASRAKHGPQIWYTGSAVDKSLHDHGEVFTRIREQGLAGSPRLAYFEWSLDFDNPENVPDEVLDDVDAWRSVNFAIERGRVTEDHMRDVERKSLSPRSFAVELLGVGDYPDTSFGTQTVIDLGKWSDITDPRSKPLDPVVFSFDVSPERRKASIGVTGKRRDGNVHLEVVDNREGTNWVTDRVAELFFKHSASTVVCDSLGPAASMVPELQRRGVVVEMTDSHELAKACGMLVDGVENGTVRHLGQPELAGAIRGADTRPLGDAVAWSRKKSSSDITPLMVATLGLWVVANSGGGGLAY